MPFESQRDYVLQPKVARHALPSVWLSGCIHRLTMNRRRLFQIAALAGLLPLALPAEDWPRFRGPYGNGVAQENEAPLHWGPGKNVRWKATLPGPGNSSPIVSHGRVFKTCAEDAGKKRNLYCFDRRTGKELWARTVAFPVVEPMHKSNPYCASTPAADGARVVVWHGSAGVFCVDYPEWAFDPNAGGPRATPVARDGRLFTLGALTARSKNCCRYVATSPL